MKKERLYKLGQYQKRQKQQEHQTQEEYWDNYYENRIPKDYGRDIHIRNACLEFRLNMIRSSDKEDLSTDEKSSKSSNDPELYLKE